MRGGRGSQKGLRYQKHAVRATNIMALHAVGHLGIHLVHLLVEPRHFQAPHYEPASANCEHAYVNRDPCVREYKARAIIPVQHNAYIYTLIWSWVTDTRTRHMRLCNSPTNVWGRF